MLKYHQRVQNMNWVNIQLSQLMLYSAPNSSLHNQPYKAWNLEAKMRDSKQTLNNVNVTPRQRLRCSTTGRFLKTPMTTIKSQRPRCELSEGENVTWVTSDFRCKGYSLNWQRIPRRCILATSWISHFYDGGNNSCRYIVHFKMGWAKLSSFNT